MATATATDEENIIILDDEVTTYPEIKIEEPDSSEDIIDFWGNLEETSNDLDLWSFWDDISTKTEESIVEEKKEEVDLEETSTDLDLWSFWDDASTKTEEPIVEEKKEEVDLEETSTDLDLWSFWDDASIKDTSLTKDNASDLNSILDETIVKLQSRSDIIAEDKIVEQANITDFKFQIADLESSVASSESIVSDLNKEAAKIRSNIKSLERMKLKDEVTEVQKETSVKVHNTKRVRK